VSLSRALIRRSGKCQEIAQAIAKSCRGRSNKEKRNLFKLVDISPN
jgi:hypothetical protein